MPASVSAAISAAELKEHSPPMTMKRLFSTGVFVFTAGPRTPEAQQWASSAHQPFSAKMQKLHRSNEFSSSGEKGVFARDASGAQANASDVHRTKSRLNHIPSIPYAGLSLFEQKASKHQKEVSSQSIQKGISQEKICYLPRDSQEK